MLRNYKCDLSCASHFYCSHYNWGELLRILSLTLSTFPPTPLSANVPPFQLSPSHTTVQQPFIYSTPHLGFVCVCACWRQKHEKSKTNFKKSMFVKKHGRKKQLQNRIAKDSHIDRNFLEYVLKDTHNTFHSIYWSSLWLVISRVKINGNTLVSARVISTTTLRNAVTFTSAAQVRVKSYRVINHCTLFISKVQNHNFVWMFVLLSSLCM